MFAKAMLMGSSQAGLYKIGESLRFNDDDNAELTRTPSASGNQRTWTYSAWVKRTLQTGEADTLFCAATSSTDRAWAFFRRSSGTTYTDSLHIIFQDSGGTARELLTTAVFRDPSAWYHVVVALDTTQSTASERAKVYVNGVQITDLIRNTYPLLNEQFPLNESGTAHLINGIQWTAAYNGDMYLSDVYLIDGEALDPSRFGKQDADGIWQPISYTGSYGTNGFHLEFADNSTAAALGTDTSGNGNDWTPSGITTDDQVTDTPSVNYCTMNPLDTGAAHTLSDGNLRISQVGTNWDTTRSTFALTSGKWYWEIGDILSASYIMVGLSKSTQDLAIYPGQDADGYGYYSTNGNLYNNGSTAYGATYGVGDTVGVSFDADIGELIFYKNGVSQGVAATGLTNDLWFPSIGVHTSAATFNFGQRPFAYTPPTGFQALNSSNLPVPTIKDGSKHFESVLYTGSATTQSIGGLEFQPDFVWIKRRDGSDNHVLADAVRGSFGAGLYSLFSNLTNAESTSLQVLTLDSDGFTVEGDRSATNRAGQTYVAWNWNAGGSTVTNTDGTITSQVRANTTAGFSIVSYTGNGSASGIGHGLNSAPDLVIAKNRQDSGTTGSTNSNWAVYHSALGYTKNLQLNSSGAPLADPNYWGNADPDASVVYVNNYNVNNASGKSYIMYAFHSVDGFSKFGSYTGNGSTDGPFVYTGFRPAFVMVKRTDAAGYNWAMMDSERSPYNRINSWLYANLTNAQDTSLRDDLLSNGFKVRQSGAGINASGGTYIFMAFAENPFKKARAR